MDGDRARVGIYGMRVFLRREIVVSVADERVVVWDERECADGEVCAGGGGGLALGVFIIHGSISNRGYKRQLHLHLL